MSRRKPRSPGVMLRGRAQGLGRWAKEIDIDGGKPAARRRVRSIERARFRRELAAGEHDGPQEI